jgi:hypothetical protein
MNKKTNVNVLGKKGGGQLIIACRVRPKTTAPICCPFAIHLAQSLLTGISADLHAESILGFLFPVWSQSLLTRG